jgi:DNA-binding SARP family transcriptional activator/LysM repeat protein
MNTSLRTKLAPAAALSLLLVGPPLLLWSLVGWPLPSASALREAIDLRWVSPTLAQQFGATVAWAAWLYIAACITSSILGQARHATVSLPLPHTFAGWINATVALLLVGSGVSGRHTAAPISPPVATVAYQASTVSQQTSAAASTSYDVQPRDTLWDIAEQHLGSPLRWREIWHLNAHQAMRDGTSFTDPNIIRPGWQLTMPGSTEHAVGHVPTARPAPQATHHHPAAPETLTNAPLFVPQDQPTPSHGAENQPEQRPGAATTSGPENTATSEHGSSMPVGLGLGAAAAGVVAVLARRRRRAMRKRPVGMRLPLPTGDLAAAEHALTNRNNLDSAHAIAGTLRLAAALTPPDAEPVLELLIDNPDGIELRFTGVIQLPEPFVATDEGYRLPREHISATYAAADRADPAPALVHLGDDDRGSIYLNLEALGAVAFDGDAKPCADLIQRILTSASSCPWSALTEVRVTNDRDAANDLLGTSTVVDLTDEVHRLAALAGPTAAEVERAGGAPLASLRWRSDEPPDGVSLVIAHPSDAGVDELVVLARDRRNGIVAVLSEPHLDLPTIKVTSEAILLPDATLVAVPAIPAECVEAVRELIDLTDAPYVQQHDAPYGEVLEHAPPSAETTEVVVRVLGSLEIDGPVPHLPPLLRDIVLYLALHRRGVSLLEMATALWPEALRSEKTLRNRMHELRRALGGRVSLGPGWRFDDTVTTDWAQFQAWSKGSLADRQRALDLVRGQPLREVKGDWPSLEGFEAEMEARIVDLALEVSEALLDAGEPTAAMESVRAGLRACPWEERLYQLGMRSAADRGAIGELKTLYAELRAILDIEDDAEPDPETEAMYHGLLDAARRVAAQ